MRIFVTGGAGFIGYHLALELIQEGHEVMIYDNFINYINPIESHYPLYLNYRLTDLGHKVKIVRGDIRHRGCLVDKLKQFQPDVVIHLAAIPIAKLSKKYSEDMTSINLNGTITVLESMGVIPSIRRFVYASSSFVYGNFIYEPADEEHPTNPIDMYGGTKLAGEIFTKIYCKKYNIDWIIIRPSAVYGPTDCNCRVSQIFMENKLNHSPVFLEGGGETKLDFTYVKDTVLGFRLACEKDNVNNQIFNITYGKGRAIKDYARILGLETINTKTDMERPERGALDITKATTLLDYKPQYPLERGIKEYEDFARRIL